MNHQTSHRSIRFRLVFAMCLLPSSIAFAAATAGNAGKTQVNAPRLDPTVQAFIQGMLSTNSHEMFSGTEDQLREKMKQLRELTGRDQKTLVEQLLCYRVRAKGMKESLLPLIIVDQLGVTADAVVEGLVPYLESSDKRVVKEAAEWLSGTDWAPGRQSVDFQRYETLLRTNQPAIPLGLVRYLFNRAPRTALQTVVRVYEADVADAELRSRLRHLDPNVFRASAKEDLEYFVARPEWWAQLFVASALADDPELYGWDFRRQMLARLEKSDHPLVREKVADLKARFSPR